MAKQYTIKYARAACFGGKLPERDRINNLQGNPWSIKSRKMHRAKYIKAKLSVLFQEKDTWIVLFLGHMTKKHWNFCWREQGQRESWFQSYTDSLFSLCG